MQSFTVIKYCALFILYMLYSSILLTSGCLRSAPLDCFVTVHTSWSMLCKLQWLSTSLGDMIFWDHHHICGRLLTKTSFSNSLIVLILIL